MAELVDAIDGIVELNRFDQPGDEADDYMDAEFGPLQMFDSNSAEAPMSSLPQDDDAEQREQAPTAVMDAAEPPSSTGKKSKRDKKSKKKKHGSIDLGDGVTPSSSKRSKRHANALDASSTNGAPAAATEPSSPTQPKRKRDPADGANSRGGRKRQRAQDNAAMDPEDAYGDNTVEAQVAAQLRQDNEDNADQPVVAARDVSLDSQDLAREAMNEFMSSRNRAGAANDDGSDADMAEDHPPIQDHSRVYEDPEAPEPQAQPSELTPSRPQRAARTKKAKPTFFEQPPEYNDEGDGNYDAYEELPSPSAGTPKPRRRAKAATRKPKAQRLSQSMRGGSDEEDNGEPRGRRNRMEGYTQGRFTDEEIERIGRVVASFRDNNDLSQHDVNEMIHAPGGTAAGESHSQLWASLFAECPDRHRQKVINITRKKFHNFVARGTWTTEQDAELRMLINVHGQKWSIIAGMINRHPEDIRDRYRNYIICGDSQRKDSWNEEEEMKLTRHVREAMQAVDEMRAMHPGRDALQNSSYEELIDWQDISQRMDRTRSRLQCITKWRSMNLQISSTSHLASLEPGSGVSFQLDRARQQIKVMPTEERFRLLIAIKGCSVSSDAKIPWQKLIDKNFRNEWHRSTQTLLWHRMRKTVPDWHEKTVRDCAQHLVDRYNLTDGGLPDVDGDDYNDAEEMAVIQSTASHAGGSGGGKSEGKTKSKRRSAKSDEIIDPSTEEDRVLQLDGEADVNAQEGLEPEVDAGLQIDPALAGLSGQPEDVIPEADLEATQGMAPEAMMQEAPAEAEPGSPPEAKVEAPKSARKGGKKAPRAKKRAAAEAPMVAASSDAEDMADIPAKSPAA